MQSTNNTLVTSSTNENVETRNAKSPILVKQPEDEQWEPVKMEEKTITPGSSNTLRVPSSPERKTRTLKSWRQITTTDENGNWRKPCLSETWNQLWINKKRVSSYLSSLDVMISTIWRQKKEVNAVASVNLLKNSFSPLFQCHAVSWRSTELKTKCRFSYSFSWSNYSPGQMYSSDKKPFILSKS